MKQGWENEKLQTFVSQFIVPQRDKPKVFDGDIPWCRIEDFDGVYLSKSKSNKCVSQKTIEQMPLRVYPVNTVLVSCSADLGRCAITLNPLVTNQTFIGLVPSNKLDSLFLYYLMKNRASELNNLATGATIKYLSKKKFQNLDVSIPPLDEQKRIVAKLDQCFEAIDKARANVEKNLQNAKELFQSRMADLFSTRDSSWSKHTLLELLDKGWIESHLDGNHGGDYPRKNEFVDEGISYISANCLIGGYVDFSKSKYLTRAKANSLRKGIAKNNDILFAHNATVGKTAILKTNLEKVIISTSLTYYRCNPAKIYPEYLLLYLRSKEFIKQYESVMVQSTRNQVPITKQRTFYHLIPPIKKQKIIIDKLGRLLSKTQSLESNYHQELDALDELKKSILQKAFNGEL